MSTFSRHALLASALLALCLQQALAQGSGFIEDMPVLAPDPDRAGAKMWQKPGLNRAAYKYVIIEPVEIFIAADSDYKGLNADELKTLADGFREVLVNTLQPEILVVDQPGPEVMVLRAAISDVHLKKKKRGLLGYTPVGVVVTAARDAVGARVSMKDAVLEVEILDASSQERIGVLVDRAPVETQTGDISWESIEHSFAYYAERFKLRMQGSPVAE
jgi:hypothetical protein